MYFLAFLLPILALCLLRLRSRSRLAQGDCALLDFSAERLVSLRGILALLIVMHHFTHVYVEQWPLLAPFRECGMPMVSAFFFISGYGLCRSLQSKGGVYLDSFMRRRCAHLLPPLLIVMAASWALCMLVYQSDTIATLVGKLAYLDLSTPSTWFMVALMLVYIGFYISARICRGRIMPTGAGLALFVAAQTMAFIAAGFHAVWIGSTPALVVGYFVSACETPRPPASTRRIAAAVATIFFLAAIMAYLAFTFKFMYIPRNMAFAVLIYLAVRAGGTPSWRLLHALGRYSLEIFLTHGLWIDAARHLALDAAPAAFMVAAGTAVSAFLLHVACGALARRLAPRADNMSAPAAAA